MASVDSSWEEEQVMKRYQQRIGFFLGTCLTMFWLLTAAGCPSQPGTPDGGVVPDGGKVTPLACEKGILCLGVGNDKVRACDVLLKNGAAVSNPQVDFSAGAVGQFKYRDSRLALSFIVRGDSGFGSESAALVKLGDGVAQLELSSATCYDRNGNKVDQADLTLRRP